MWGSIAAAAGNLLGAAASHDSAREDRSFQKEFAQSGIQWKADDARAAGIHPLYAMGAQGASFTPVGDGGVGNQLADLGQNVGRAIDARQTREERKYSAQMKSHALEKARLQNELLKSQITNINASGGPPGPSDLPNFMGGQSQSGTKIRRVPKEVTEFNANIPSDEAGWVPDQSYTRSKDGLVPMIPEKAAESMESDPLGAIDWYLRNKIAPMFMRTQGPDPEEHKLPEGLKWVYHPLKRTWVPAPLDHPEDLIDRIPKGFFEYIQKMKQNWKKRRRKYDPSKPKRR